MFIDLTGKRFGKLIALKQNGKNKFNHIMWECKCDCGNIVSIDGCALRSGHTKSCGKCYNPQTEIGKQFGRLTIVEYIGRIKRGKLLFKCKCECGNIVECQLDNLKSGHTKSCGCLTAEKASATHTKHGQKHSRIYNIWCKLRERCYKPNCRQYKFYGGRGIKVCNEWQGEQGFINFYEWAISNGYSDTLTIDRINTNGDYEPSNCRWVTIKEQQNNRRSNKYIEIDGEKMTISQAAQKYNVDYKLFWSRLKRGWDIEKAILPKMR